MIKHARSYQFIYGNLFPRYFARIDDYGIQSKTNFNVFYKNYLNQKNIFEWRQNSFLTTLLEDTNNDNNNNNNNNPPSTPLNMMEINEENIDFEKLKQIKIEKEEEEKVDKTTKEQIKKKKNAEKKRQKRQEKKT